ncbi:MAG: site-2 protease family protein [archaeon]
MSFLSSLFDYRWTILFYSAILLAVYVFRKKLERQGSFMYIIRTKIGLQFMDKISSAARKPIIWLGYAGIVIAYIGFFFISYVLLQGTYDLLIDKPGAVGGGPVIPGLPIGGTGIVFPLVIGWISLLIIMVVHEGAHGILARAHNIKVKSSGLAFLGPILGAFVEPDEKDMQKKKHRVQHSVLAAGPVSNLVLWIVCMILIVYVLSPAVSGLAISAGIYASPIKNDSLPAMKAGFTEKTVIVGINNAKINDSVSFFSSLENLTPGQKLRIDTLSGEHYDLTTIKNPENKSKGYIGITKFEQYYAPKIEGPLGNILLSVLLWFIELLEWTAFISFNIGLINLFPIFITDGAQMLKLNFLHLIHDKKKALNYWKSVNIVALMMVFIMLFLPLLRTLFKFAISFVLSI